VESIRALRQALHDPDEGVRSVTRQALEKLTPLHPQARAG
jgi:hypothetical protein